MEDLVRRFAVPVGIGLAGIFALALIPRISPVSVVVGGLQVGSVYALVALGIALIYKATRVLNFAQGELGTVPGMLAYAYFVDFNLEENATNVPTSELVMMTVVAMVVGAGLAVLINVGVVRRLANATPVTSLVATAGVMLLFIGAQLYLFGANIKPFPRFVDGAAFTLGTVPVQWQTILVLGVLAVASVALAAFFRTPVGVGLLATSQEPFASELYGISPVLMSSIAWGMAGALGGLAGILGAGEFTSVNPGYMTGTFLVPAFTGAVLGGITSMAGAVIGSLILGLASVLANTFVVEYNLTASIPGPPAAVTFAILLLVLFVRPRGLLGKEA
jgi:branched-chain amino acid transport system permease protein